MKQLVFGMALIATQTAGAAPVTGVGAEAAWLLPRTVEELDLERGVRRPVSLDGKRALPPHGFLLTQLLPGEIAWLRFDRDDALRSVRVAFVSGGAGGWATVDAEPTPFGGRGFLVAASAGPPRWLGLAARDGAAPKVEVFIAAAQSPGYRWELWEEAAKDWAARPITPPPAPPTAGGVPLVDSLATVADAIALARAAGGDAPVEPLLRAEALLSDLLWREPGFPYFRRVELTGEVGAGRPRRSANRRAAFDVEPGTLRFTVDGPGLLRVDAWRVFPAGTAHRREPLELSLHAGARLLAVTSDVATPIERAPGESLSSVRRLTFAAPPGKHAYELRVRGGTTRLAVYLHKRSTHAEDLFTQSENLGLMLARARMPSPHRGLLGELVAGEAAWLALDDEAARPRFEAVAASAPGARLRAFALGRLAALDGGDAADRRAAEAAAALGTTAPADLTLRDLLVAERIARRLAAGDRATAMQLAREWSSALARYPALIAPALRDAPGARSSSLPLLDAAARAQPLDGALRHRLAQEWWLGSQWAALPLGEHDGAQRVELVGPAEELHTCAQATEHGAHAYVRLAPGARTALRVAGSPSDPLLRRFHLLAIRPGGPRLGFLDLTLDGEKARVPLVQPAERIAFAAAVGEHQLEASASGVVLAPCALLDGQGEVVVEHRYARLTRGASARASLLEPGVDGYLGLELRAAPELKDGRITVRTDAGVLGTVEVRGAGVDERLLGGEALGPPVLVVLRVPAGARELAIVRDDAGPPLLVRALLRRGTGPVPTVAPRSPALEPDAARLGDLRARTAAVRGAATALERARARVARARQLVELDALTAARSDLELALALPALEAGEAEQARALLRSLAEPPLLPAGASRARVLAPGAGLGDTGEVACVDAALQRGAADRAAARALLNGCRGALAAWAAARLDDDAGLTAEAGRAFADAYALSHRPALAREAATRLAERGGPGAAEAYALAATAARDGDLDGARALRRLSATSRWRGLVAVDAGAALHLDEDPPPAASLRAALADVPWPEGTWQELHAGRLDELVFDVDRKLAVEIHGACDVAGRLDDPDAACHFRVAVDGAPVAAGPVQSGGHGRVAHLSLRPGAHRIQVALERPTDQTVAFLHVTTDRRIGSSTLPPDADGSHPMPARAPRPHRFAATTGEPVRLRVQGPTVLKLDALSTAAALEVTDGGERHVYSLCGSPRERLARPVAGFPCRSTVLVPLAAAGTHDVTLRPSGASTVAVALAVREEQAAPPPSAAAPAPELPDRRLEPPPLAAELTMLPPPMTRSIRDFGTLQLQQLGVIGGPGGANPRIGDRFSETEVLYRRKVDHLPLWLLGGAYLRLRPGNQSAWGPPSAGGQFLWFLRIPRIRLRWLGDARIATQSVSGHQEVSIALETYFERSFEVAPRLYLLPRAALRAKYQSLGVPPTPPRNDLLAATPIDPQVWNSFDAHHDVRLYGQLLLWWVPFINMVVYAEGRAETLRVSAIDRISVRAGFDVAFHTTELIAYYDLTESFADEARRSNALRQRIAGEINQTVWLRRNHRLVLRAGGFFDPVQLSSTVFFGAFWEFSVGRGLDDYSTPQINLPQQLGRGRGILGPEHRL